jgi:TPR repeat protein
MNQLFFWTDWQTPYKQLYWGLLILFFSTVAFFLTAWAIGLDLTFPWQTYAQSETIQITIDTIQIGPYQLPLEVDSYLLTESFEGGGLTLYNWPSYLYVGLLGLIFSMALTCVTTLMRFWYLVGMAIVITFLMSLKLENLLLFGSVDKLGLVIVFVLYVPLSYYFQSINNLVTFTNRLISFLSATAIFGLIVFFAAGVELPFLHLATYGYTAPIIISLLFILLIGHQMLVGFMYIITSSNNVYSKNSLTHFLIITIVYLVNLLIIVLNEVQFIYWDFVNIHPFVLLVISSLIGIVMYSLSEETYKHIYKFQPIGGYIYLLLGSICFFTIGYHLFSANDGVIEVFEDFILYAHLGYGFMFFVYILANFVNPLGNNKQVYRVLYDPQNMPFFTYRFAGSIAVLGFVLASNYNIPIYHAMSAYYNGVGDLHLRKGERKIAAVYYKKGKSLDYGNHRANYTLGEMARSDANNTVAAYYFSEAIRKRPTPQAFVNMGNIHLDQGKFFDGLFTIRDGKDEFPNTERLKINLGLLYDRADEADSAFLTFQDSRTKSVTERSANVNTLSLISKGDYEYNLDSIIEEYIIEDHTALINNGLVLHNSKQIMWDAPIAGDTLLNIVSGASLYNKSINNIFGLDSTYLSSLPEIAMLSQNISFREQLLFAAALGYYYHLEVEKAFIMMDQLANNYPVKSGFYYYVLGLWSLDQESTLLAVDFFKKSLVREYDKAHLALAIASMEAGLIDEAKVLWEELTLEVNPVNRQMAEGALRMLRLSDLSQMSNAEKYWYWRYQVTKENEVQTQEIIDAIEDVNYKDRIRIDLVNYFIEKGDKGKATFYGDVLNQNWNGSWDDIAKMDFLGRIDSAYYAFGVKSSIPKSRKLQSYYYGQRYAHLHNDTTRSDALFDKANANPFFEQGVIGKANYLVDNGEDFEAYNTILSAIEVNPYAIGLLKRYIMHCAVMDFDRHGNDGLEELQPLVSSQEFKNFELKYLDQLQLTQRTSEFFND